MTKIKGPGKYRVFKCSINVGDFSLLVEMTYVISLQKKARFIRISVHDGDGGAANSRGFFPEEWAE